MAGLLWAAASVMAWESGGGIAPKTDLPLPPPLPPLEHPNGNRATKAKIALGRQLFFDARLSRDERVACATCHDPERGFSDGRRLALGIEGREGKRHVPSLINVGYSTALFWDGRAKSLEQQALLPIQHRDEMDLPLETLERRLNGVAEYRVQFQEVFGAPATASGVAQALAAYQRTLIANETPFDRYLAGEQEALSAAAQRGMVLFFGQARCAICHSGAYLSDQKFHNIGTADPRLPRDSGRRTVTKDARDEGAFRTPQLRDVARSAPYMHHGNFATLHDVVRHYNFGGVTDEPNPHRDESLQVLYLSEDDVDDLVVFLQEGLANGPPRASDSSSATSDR
jgi:cytochrome c peroxidase